MELRSSAVFEVGQVAAAFLDLAVGVVVGGQWVAVAGDEGGEVTRYLGTYGQRRVRGAVLLAPLPPLPPFLPRSDANPDGADRAVFDDFLVELALDRPVAIKTYLDRYYNIDLLGGSRVSDQAWQNSFHVAIQVSAAWPRAVRPHGRKTSGPMLPASPSRS